MTEGKTQQLLVDKSDGVVCLLVATALEHTIIPCKSMQHRHTSKCSATLDICYAAKDWIAKHEPMIDSNKGEKVEVFELKAGNLQGQNFYPGSSQLVQRSVMLSQP